jgi:predicted nucleic acid-binding protein
MPTDTPAESETALLDTSTAIALLLEAHEAHSATLAAVRGLRLGLAGHAWFETYSVLTRLPGAQRRSPADAARLLSHNFPASAFLGADVSRALGPELAGLGISGGSVYDALVGATARQHHLRLLTSDVRARPVYELLGVDVQLLAAAG